MLYEVITIGVVGNRSPRLTVNGDFEWRGTFAEKAQLEADIGKTPATGEFFIVEEEIGIGTVGFEKSAESQSHRHGDNGGAVGVSRSMIAPDPYTDIAGIQGFS